MEGWDGTTDGRPTDLVRRRWARFGSSGCGLVWGEATAVRPDGRANPNQLVIDETTVDDIAALRSLLAPDQVAGLQLTHSGRYARPDGQPAPRTAYRHPLLDERVGAGRRGGAQRRRARRAGRRYVDGAVLARQAGFDFVDIKHCHGYLLHELLSGYDRPGRYGGDLAGRTRFLRTVVDGIRARRPDLAIAVRLSLFDLVPFSAGADGVGVPETDGSYPYAFGGDGTGLGIDLTETHAAARPPRTARRRARRRDGREPVLQPARPAAGVLPPVRRLPAARGPARRRRPPARSHRRDRRARIRASPSSAPATRTCRSGCPTWPRPSSPSGGASMVGLGRMVLSYPELAADVLAGRPLRPRSVCRTFSDCTTAPRNGLVSGCFPLDPFYKEHPQRVELARAKKAAKTSTSQVSDGAGTPTG